MTDEEEFKTEIKDKVKYKESRVLHGHAPHKLFKLEIHKYLEKIKTEIKDIFDIDKIKWKDLDEN